MDKGRTRAQRWNSIQSIIIFQLRFHNFDSDTDVHLLVKKLLFKSLLRFWETNKAEFEFDM